jgi:hypothetical protein
MAQGVWIRWEDNLYDGEKKCTGHHRELSSTGRGHLASPADVPLSVLVDGDSMRSGMGQWRMRTTRAPKGPATSCRRPEWSGVCWAGLAAGSALAVRRWEATLGVAEKGGTVDMDVHSRWIHGFMPVAAAR